MKSLIVRAVAIKGTGSKAMSGNCCKAVISIRQSSPKQVREHLDSQLTQRTLIRRAEHLGWHPERIEVFDGDLGQSAAGMQERDDFRRFPEKILLC
jgi:hypothetical protein